MAGRSFQFLRLAHLSALQGENPAKSGVPELRPEIESIGRNVKSEWGRKATQGSLAEKPGQGASFTGTTQSCSPESGLLLWFKLRNYKKTLIAALRGMR
ncbi:MAG TPA: hypothetical protein VLT16_06935 [Candidatus Limnocylindrales bacterium]|nr:hypothetical protein [Candidatus Limnocylindrales bacterium]